LTNHFGRWFLHGLEKITEETARKPSSEMDSPILTWTFDSLDEDLEMKRFCSSIPGFCSSTLVEGPLGTFINPNEDKLCGVGSDWIDGPHIGISSRPKQNQAKTERHLREGNGRSVPPFE